MKNKLVYVIAFTSFMFLLNAQFKLNAQSHISMQSHQNSVTALASLEIGNSADENSFFSAGQDGFLIKWTEDGSGEHYQISDLEIRLIARSPNGTDIAVYETDGGLVNRVSVWNWKTLTRKYAKRFSNAVTALSYSEKGTYLIVGTATVNGIVFLNASSGSQISGKIQEQSGIISMARSSATENSMVLYSPAGSLTYINMRTGRQKARFNVAQGLKQPVLFNNNVFFAGVNDAGISVVQATTGTEAKFVKASNPLLLCSRFDRDLYYLESDGKAYALKVLENLDNNTVGNPKTVKTISKLPGGEAIVCGVKSGNDILLGSQKGHIYKTDSDYASSPSQIPLYPLTDDIYDRIYDISQAGESFYFLTKNAVFKSSYDNSFVDKAAENSNQTNIITYNDNLILWTRNSVRPVQLINLNRQATTNLFMPSKNLQSLRLFGDTLIALEGNTTVNKYDLKNNNFERLYEGSALQDAALYGENILYVAKSSATNPPSSLIFIDVKTKETVPVSMSSNVTYSLNYTENTALYGISVYENSSGNSRTELFSLTPETRAITSIMQLNDEDPNAFIKLYSSFIYTNLGKSKIISYNTATKRQFNYKRSASLPLKIERNSSRLVVLNRDGSISWYNPELGTVLADWYMTTEGQWFEF
ncbi:hypothetical protein HRQ91_05510 [Treponema parvum]|uniref:WD40 repeat domain-containing protein n=1 Tax=Treponema parvum TaxID=138851 RepID=A0A975F3E1_9SPIR|nr:hypothetical protein [Treponema parvum]QTQ13955.1 hypothetical protein HRQ91_05510 [Treponema parvum]